MYTGKLLSLLPRFLEAQLVPAVIDNVSTPTSLTHSKVQASLQLATTKDPVHPKLDMFLGYIDANSTTKKDTPPVRKDTGMDSLIKINPRNEVVVDVAGYSPNAVSLQSALVTNGYQVINCYKHKCAIYLHIDRIKEIVKLPEIRNMKLALASLNRHSPTNENRRNDLHRRHLQGSVTSEAVRAMFVDVARSRYRNYNINGAGITVGIMSDSFDCLGTQARIDIRTGDLPPFSRINVLADLDANDSQCTDEGRAMMQLIYDIAPGANFAFHTAFRGEADFAAGIIALADAGCQIIVDDIIYFAEPFFQDGIIALAVNEVASRGVHYFSSVGNAGNSAWDGTVGFTNSLINAYTNETGTFHSFGLDTNGSHVVLQPFRTRQRSENIFCFQWDESFNSPTGNGGSRSELEINVLDGDGNLLAGTFTADLDFEPYEVIAFDTSNIAPVENSDLVDVYVSIVLRNGPPPAYMKIISVRSGTFAFSNGTEAASWGHSNAASAASVGAADYLDTPAFGVSPPIVESFSSNGGTPKFYDGDSNRLPVPEIRPVPRFTGPDGVSTTFFSPPDNIFFGTSASAPNVAAVAALMLQLHALTDTVDLAPSELFQILESTAIDMTSTVGFDYRTGYGFVNASGALFEVSPTTPNCGLFGLNLFCPRKGRCGLFRRLFNINGC